MEYHRAEGHPPIPCLPGCRVCRRIEVGGPHYSEDYHRLFDPLTAPPAPIAARPSEAPQAPQLAGDRVASWTHRTGLDRLAAAWTALTGRGCGCDARRRWLNRLHAALLALRRPGAW